MSEKYTTPQADPSPGYIPAVDEAVFTVVGPRIEDMHGHTRSQRHSEIQLLAVLFGHPWFFIIAAMILLVIVGGGSYLYHNSTVTRLHLEQTVARLHKAETQNQANQQRLLATEKRLLFTQNQQDKTFANLQLRQLESYSSIKRELKNELTRIQAEADRMFQTVTAKVDAVRAGNEAFKRIYSRVRDSILFIRTDYEVEFLQTGEIKQFSGFGTGFFISPAGVGMTAQHVLFPWKYDKELQALKAMGQVNILKDSRTVTMWLTGKRVYQDQTGPPTFQMENAYQMSRDRKDIHLHYVPELELIQEYAMSPIGPIPVTMPKKGQGDYAVFQILDFSRRFKPLSIEPSAGDIDPLDEVMVVGYPFGFAQDGIASPQPSQGRVRRLVHGFLELDSRIFPGNSGGPILNQKGRVIGLASAYMDSPSYGIAIRREELRLAWEKVKSSIRVEQRRLAELGCDPGPFDGIPGRKTWKAYQCAEQYQSAGSQNSRWEISRFNP